MKKLKKPIFYLQWILILFSVLAFALAVVEGFKMNFDPSSIGFQTFLKLFEPYSILFTATFVVITSHLAIERLGLMSDANNTAFMASNRILWMQTVKEFFPEIKKNDPYICKELTKQLLFIHDYLFLKKYVISNIDETKEFFNKFFANKVSTFEMWNRNYMNIAYYRDEQQAYSWDNFIYIIKMMVDIDQCYKNFIRDLSQLYTPEVVKFSREFINPTMYKSAYDDYSRRKREGTAL